MLFNSISPYFGFYAKERLLPFTLISLLLAVELLRNISQPVSVLNV